MMEIVGKMKYLYITILLIAMTGCSRHSNFLQHQGQRKLIDECIELESVIIDADTTSLRGNFVMMDSSLMFIDNLYCKIYEFSANDGKLVNTYSGYGQGPNEMTGIMYGSVIHPADTVMWILDSSYGVYEFNHHNGKVKFKGRLGLSQDNLSLNDYSSPSCYIVMEMSDFGLSINQLNDSTLLVPVSIVNRNFKSIDEKRYTSGHIFGTTDSESLKIKELIGKFPEYYFDNPLPFFEFFDHAVDYTNKKLFVNHAVDSLIYCCDYHGNPIYTVGFEPKGVNRNYTRGYDSTMEKFKDDISHVGTNSGLYYDNERDLLFRTSLCDLSSGKVIMQVYKDNDLLIEQEMPEYFKLLGRVGDNYVGVRFLPLENEEKSNFVIYKFNIDV